MKKTIKNILITILMIVVILVSITTSSYKVLATNELEQTEEGNTTGNTILTEDEVSQITLDEDGDSDLSGGVIYKSFIKLLAFIGDSFIKLMQEIFLGFSTIRGTNDQGEEAYAIFYSPGQIFSNKIPAFDINFINPKENSELSFEGKLAVGETAIENEDIPNIMDSAIASYNVSYNSFTQTSGIEKREEIEEELKDKYGYNIETNERIASGGVYDLVSEQILNSHKGATIYKTEQGYYIITITGSIGSATGGNLTHTYEYYVVNEETSEQYQEDSDVHFTQQSSAAILQPTVSKWYKALRTISLVGLMSVLVYIGIRIVISSTGKEKAKYQKWLPNWIAAICIVFLLQFIMAGVLLVTESITSIISSGITGEDSNVIKPDTLITETRSIIAENPEKYICFPEVIIYLALVIYSGVFTFQYLKRVIYMAFLTLISPLIALTYPLDKIKDGKSQAFDMWLKEYIYNALLQVIHLLIYYVFVDSAQTLVAENPIYAIVVIGMIIPSEKLIRKMFGFKNQESMGTFEAAAGGALTMNAINQISQMAGKDGSSSGGKEKSENKGSNSQVRMSDRSASGEYAMQSPIDAFSRPNGGDYSAEPPKLATPPKIGLDLDENDNPQGSDRNNPKPTNQTKPKSQKGKGGTNGPRGTNDSSDTNGSSGRNNASGKRRGKKGKGVKVTDEIAPFIDDIEDEMSTGTLGMDLDSPVMRGKIAEGKVIRGLRAVTEGKGKKYAKKAAKLAAGTLGAGIAGTIGLAAGVASGDLSKSITYATTGIAAGNSIGQGIIEKTDQKVESLKETAKTFREGYEGIDYEAREEERQNERFLHDASAIKKYRANFRNYEKAMNVALEFRRNGITDDDKIIRAIKIGVEERASLSKMISIAKRDLKFPDSSYRDRVSREEYRRNVETTIFERLQKNNIGNDIGIEKENRSKARTGASDHMRLLGRLKKIEL